VRIVSHLTRILALAEQPGPFIYGIYATAVDALTRELSIAR
jgi:hypothetical protein